MPPALDSQLLKLLAAPAPALSAELAEKIVRESFGIVGSATSLSSERDQNFRIQTPSGPGYVLKVANPHEPVEVTDFQTQAMLYVAAQDPQLSTPRVCLTTAGASETVVEVAQKQRSRVRLLTYLPGMPLGRRATTLKLREQLGVCVAKLDQALQGYSHLAAGHWLLWDMTHAAALMELLDCVPNPEHRVLVGRVIQRFEQQVQSRLADLRWQVIHNDLNPSNVLVDERDPETLVGIIDFGDLVFCPLVVDVAIAAVYQLRHTPDPLDAAIQLVSAYHRVVPLEEREIDLLFDLIATRLASAVAITTWHATIQPHNRDYILRNAGSHCEMLARFEQMSRDAVRERFRMGCEPDLQ